MNYTFMQHNYVLRGKVPVPCDDPIQWAKEVFGGSDRHVKETDTSDTYISTVFLGINHAFCFGSDSPPVLFETMVFGGRHDGECERCCTWLQAEEQHDRIVNLVRNDETDRTLLELATVGGVAMTLIMLAQVLV
jgi:hypothetical protein